MTAASEVVFRHFW